MNFEREGKKVGVKVKGACFLAKYRDWYPSLAAVQTNATLKMYFVHILSKLN
jgi:hypothetical protein